MTIPGCPTTTLVINTLPDQGNGNQAVQIKALWTKGRPFQRRLELNQLIVKLWLGTDVIQ